MPKTWDKQSEISAYMHIANGMYFRIDKGISGEWYAGLYLRTPDSSHVVMDWEFESNRVTSIESAKDLAYASLKLWLQELAESV